MTEDGFRMTTTEELNDPRLPERFWVKVKHDVSTECWFWTAYKTKNGYGCFNYKGGKYYAHRAAYDALVGSLPDWKATGMVLDHLCRNRSCVNPKHLEVVTQKENLKRGNSGEATGKMQLAKTHCPLGHPYAGENLYVCPIGKRQCKTCRRIAQQRYRSRGF